MYPFLRFFLKRLCFFLKIKKVCKKKQLVFHGGLFSLFNNYKNSNADYTIETKNNLYVVKIIGVFYKHNIINFIDNQHFSIKTVPLGIFRLFSREKIKKHSPFVFHEKLNNLSLYKNFTPIIVICPVPVAVYLKSVPVGNGDDMGSYSFYTATGFLKAIENDE